METSIADVSAYPTMNGTDMGHLSQSFNRAYHRATRFCYVSAFLTSVAVAWTPAFAVFIDAQGHYGLEAETRTSPGSSGVGMYRATSHSFRLLGEFRSDDQNSLFMQVNVFDPAKGDAYLGDSRATPDEYQNSTEPHYAPYAPLITKLFVRYASDYCLLEAGRRGRDWGMGLLFDAGDRPFAHDYSVYDGVECHLNLQKFSPLGFGVGFDKLQETGTSSLLEKGKTARFGAYNNSDDLDQFYAYIMLDDRLLNEGTGSLGKAVGIYASKISSSGGTSAGGSDTQLYLADFYLNFVLPTFAFESETIFRMGKSADLASQALGGSGRDENGKPIENKMNAIGFAAALRWAVAGDALNSAKKTTLGDPIQANRHSLALEAAYAPGDSDGYYNSNDPASAMWVDNRSGGKASAIGFHKNYSPALILFNGRTGNDLDVPGAFQASRVMNAQLYGLGYTFEHTSFGNLTTKMLYASLLEGPSTAVSNFYKDKDQVPVGYHDSSLGYELDVTYTKTVTRNLDLGLAVGALKPGDAWKVDAKTPKNNYLLQGTFVYRL
jgi:hypothetical protein